MGSNPIFRKNVEWNEFEQKGTEKGSRTLRKKGNFMGQRAEGAGASWDFLPGFKGHSPFSPSPSLNYLGLYWNLGSEAGGGQGEAPPRPPEVPTSSNGPRPTPRLLL